MNLKIRRVIYPIFILIFLLVSPLVILYALGYKYNWSKKSLEQTGVFYIKSYPKNSDIFINEKEYKKDTPTQINRLLPNNYIVKVTKEGYRDWQKTLTIQPQITTFIEDISLFKDEGEFELIETGNFTEKLISKNKLYSVFLKENKNTYSLWLLNIINSKFTQAYEFSSSLPVELISWSNNHQKVLIKQNNRYYVLNPHQENSIISLKNSLNFNQVFWDSYNDNILYGIANQKLYQLDLLQNQVTLLTSKSILAAINYKTDILAIVYESGKYVLKLVKSEDDPLLALPYSLNYKFFNPGFDYITLIDRDQNNLYLLQPENTNQPVNSVLRNVNNYSWHDDQFLYWNNNELWAYFPDVNQQILLERTSQPIINAFWHPNIVYAFGQTANELKIYELDSRDQRNIYTLINFEDSDNLIAINKKGDYLFLTTKVEGVSGLYKVGIQ